MAKIKNLIEEILYEKNEKTIKLFYNVDIFIQDFKEKEEQPVKAEQPPVDTTQEQPITQEPETATPEAPQEQQPQESVKLKNKIINEDIYKSRSEGVLTLTKEDAENIQTLNDLLDYLSDKKNEEGKPIISEVAVEIVLNMVQTPQNLGDIIDKGDKVLIDLDYGDDKDDSIGIKITKLAGSNSVTISMKKDRKILTGAFNLAEFNKQIIFFRNTLV